MRKIILASQSAWRKRIFAKTGLPFRTAASGFEEDLSLKLPPKKLALRMARGKAEAIAGRFEDAIIIGADTFIVLGKRILGKPHTEKRAREMLTMLQGKWHTIVTGFVVIDMRTGKRATRAVTTLVHFRRLNRAEIHAYVATKESLEVAGAYAIQGRAGAFIDRIEGDYWNVVGLPLSALLITLRQFGVRMR